MIHLLTLLCCLLGFMALAMAAERQQHDLFGGLLGARRTRALRLAGWGALVLALGIIVAWQGWSLGLVSYSGHTSLAAGLVYLALIIHDRRHARGRTRPARRRAVFDADRSADRR